MEGREGRREKRKNQRKRTEGRGREDGDEASKEGVVILEVDGE